MVDVAPKYQCHECRRGVLNRRVQHCLYCGAQLAASVMPTEQEIAVADSNAERERKTYDLSAAPAAPDPAPHLVAAEVGFTIIDLLG